MKTQYSASGITELATRDMDEVSGGLLPAVLPVKLQTPTWKYVDGTPQWAVDAAKGAGYVVENIS